MAYKFNPLIGIGLDDVGEGGGAGTPGGSDTELQYNDGGSLAGLSTLTTDGTNITLSGQWISTLNGAASAPPVSLTGTWFTGGTSTTTKPQFLIEPTGTTSTAWSTNGTALGVNAASGFTGNLLDLQVGGLSRFKASSGGVISFGSSGTKTLTQSSQTVTLSDSIDAYAVFASYLIRDTNSRVAIGAVDLNLANGGDLGIALGALNTIGWTTSTASSGTIDLRIARDAAGIFAQRNGTNAQTFRCYGTYTDASNYVRAALSSTSTAVTLAAETAGTGADDIPLNLTAAGTGTVKINSVAEIAVSSTVAGLPATPAVGMITRVTDGDSGLTFGNTVVNSGAGATPYLVWYNGTNWTIIGA